jgi:hypothetical protein
VAAQNEQAALQISIGWPIPAMRRQIVTAIRRAVNLAIIEHLQPSSRVVVCGKIFHTQISFNKIFPCFALNPRVSVPSSTALTITACYQVKPKFLHVKRATDMPVKFIVWTNCNGRNSTAL